MKLSENISKFAELVAAASDIEAIRTWGREAAELEKEMAIRDAALEMSVNSGEIYDEVSPAGWIAQARDELAGGSKDERAGV